MIRFSSRHEILRQMPKGGVCAELGVYAGDFAACIAEEMRPRELWLIDAWRRLDCMGSDPVNKTDAEMQALKTSVYCRFSSNPNVHVIDSLLHDAADLFPQDSFDFIYLDACHARESVTRDLRDWWPKVKPGGFLAGHDYHNAEGFPWIAVKPAVDEFLQENQLAIEFLSTEACGSFAVRKPI